VPELPQPSLPPPELEEELEVVAGSLDGEEKEEAEAEELPPQPPSLLDPAAPFPLPLPAEEEEPGGGPKPPKLFISTSPVPSEEEVVLLSLWLLDMLAAADSNDTVSFTGELRPAEANFRSRMALATSFLPYVALGIDKQRRRETDRDTDTDI
jgi:hypothetical protein